MKKSISLIIVLTSLVFAQDRNYIELTPIVNWGDFSQGDLEYSQNLNFCYVLALNLSISKRFSMKPFISHSFKQLQPEEELNITSPSISRTSWNTGVRLRFYLED